MVSLRDGKALEPLSVNETSPNINSKEKPQKQDHDLTSNTNTSKKRKAPEHSDEAENPAPVRPSTPPAGLQSELADEPNYERTPGRDGPIKSERSCADPDIKPFKGPPGKKVRKTRREKEDEYTQFAFENEGHTFHEYLTSIQLRSALLTSG